MIKVDLQMSEKEFEFFKKWIARERNSVTRWADRMARQPHKEADASNYDMAERVSWTLEFWDGILGQLEFKESVAPEGPRASSVAVQKLREVLDSLNDSKNGKVDI